MMFCPNCGREIPDGTVCPCTYEQPALSTNPVLHSIKSLGSSNLYLAMTICATVAVVFTVAGNFFTTVSVPALLEELVYNLTGSVDDLYAVTATASAGSLASIVSSALISGVYVAAFWLHYVTCRSRATGNIATHGLTIWKVYAWISVISAVLAAVAVAVVAALFTFLGLALSEAPEPAVVIAVVAVAVILIGVALGFTIAFAISKLRLINRTKTAALTGTIPPKVSSFLIVLSYITAGLTVVEVLGSLFVSPMSALATLADGARIFLMGMLLSRYRKAIAALQMQQQYPQM